MGRSLIKKMDRELEGITGWAESHTQCGKVQQEKGKDFLLGGSESQINMKRCNRNNKNMERHSARRCDTDRVGASLTLTI